MSEKISMIVPVYKAEKYLHQCIESILAQTYANIEIILVDDGSPDASGDICDEYAAKDERVAVIHKENGGESSARNAGIGAASGVYLGFVDSDDWIESQMVAHLYESAKKAGADLVVCGFYTEKGGRTQKHIDNGYGMLTAEQAMLAALGTGSFRGFMWNKLYKADLFTSGLRMDTDAKVCEDLVLTCRYIVRCGSVYYHPEALCHYRIHPESAIRSVGEHRYTELLSRKKLIEVAAEVGERAKMLACCRYSEAAANLLYFAVCAKDNTRIKEYRREAKRYVKQLYGSQDISAYEKMRMFLKLHFPVISTRLADRIK